MARENLGLFDTPPDRQEIRLGLLIAGLQFVGLLACLPWRNVRLSEIGAFIPAIDATMCVAELVVATQLYAQAAIFRSRALTILASGYVFGALMAILHALTFPGAFAANGWLGAGVNTTAWLAMLNGWAFPLGVILYALVKSAGLAAQPQLERPPARIVQGLAGAVLLAGLAMLLATRGQDWLPPIFLNRRDMVFGNIIMLGSVTLALTLAATALLVRRRNRSVLDMWLLVALASWLCQWALNITVQARFTVGFYGIFGLQLASRLIVTVALIAETNRLYAQLAVWAVARTRERENRMMSMDAVAAAFSHEIGQPLTAVTLSASAGLKHLTCEPADAKKAIQSLRDNLAAGRRTFEVLKSLRATFSVGSGSMSEFDLNDLVRETASLMAAECAAHRISLQLALDDEQPTVFGNRVQIQRVLVNLLTNAVESFASTRRRGRRIAIRSTSPDPDSLLLEVSDTGAGIPPEKMADIFDPFFTTKSTGTGLGLSLSSTIAEEHGGRLWASPGDDGGATFHLKLLHHPMHRQ